MMSEQRFKITINQKGRAVIIDKECSFEIIDMSCACHILNRLDLKLKHYNEVNGEQQATISKLQQELKEAIQEGINQYNDNGRLSEKLEEQQATINEQKEAIDYLKTVIRYTIPNNMVADVFKEIGEKYE